MSKTKGRNQEGGGNSRKIEFQSYFFLEKNQLSRLGEFSLGRGHENEEYPEPYSSVLDRVHYEYVQRARGCFPHCIQDLIEQIEPKSPSLLLGIQPLIAQVDGLDWDSFLD